METKYLKGIYFKDRKQGQPDFVKMSISIKVADLLAELQQSQEEYINLDVKTSKEGKLYASINTWEKIKANN